MDGLGQIGIDIWSILYYLVNYGIILAVLGYYVYPRVYAILEKRESEISRSLDSAQELKNELAKELERYHAENKKLLAESREQKKKWLEELELMKSQMYKDMDEKRSKSLEETQKLIDEKKTALLDDARQDIYALISRSFQNISKKIPESIIAESIDDAWSTIHKSK